jgi:uncharacterized protein with GYD domain
MQAHKKAGGSVSRMFQTNKIIDWVNIVHAFDQLTYTQFFSEDALLECYFS